MVNDILDFSKDVRAAASAAQVLIIALFGNCRKMEEGRPITECVCVDAWDVTDVLFQLHTIHLLADMELKEANEQ